MVLYINYIYKYTQKIQHQLMMFQNQKISLGKIQEKGD